MLRNIRNVFERAELTRQEVQTLFGVIESLHRAEPAVRDGDSFAVIFGSHQSDDLHGYGPMADAMVAAARQQPGFQRVVSARTPDDVGITVSYWDSLAAIKAWGEQHAHKVAQEKGNTQWYRDWVLSTHGSLRSAANQRINKG